MKKSLFALAAVTAFAGAAQAQSSVTVYGILDVGFAGTSARGVPAAASTGQPASATSALANTSTAGLNSSQQTTSRLGFRGTEALGGGTSAFFTVEFNLTPTSPDLLLAGGQNVLNRQTFVGLSQKGIGNASIGTQYTPIFNLLAATDPGQTNNGVGSVIYPQGGGGVTSNALIVRQNNSIRFETERMSGVQVIGYYSQANTDSRQTAAANTQTSGGGTANNAGWGVNGNFQHKKLYVGVAYQSFKNETDATANANLGTGVVLPTTGASVATNGTNITDTGMFAGAVYDFGILKAYANYVSRKMTSVLDSNQYLKRSAQQLGVRGYVTPKIEAFATIGNGSYKSYGAGQPTSSFTGYQLGTNYWLSKRPNLYGMYGATQSSNVTTVGGVQVSSGASQYAMGVRHTF
jgi:predicted porin